MSFVEDDPGNYDISSGWTIPPNHDDAHVLMTAGASLGPTEILCTTAASGGEIMDAWPALHTADRKIGMNVVPAPSATRATDVYDANLTG